MILRNNINPHGGLFFHYEFPWNFINIISKDLVRVIVCFYIFPYGIGTKPSTFNLCTALLKELHALRVFLGFITDEISFKIPSHFTICSSQIMFWTKRDNPCVNYLFSHFQLPTHYSQNFDMECRENDSFTFHNQSNQYLNCLVRSISKQKFEISMNFNMKMNIYGKYSIIPAIF